MWMCFVIFFFFILFVCRFLTHFPEMECFDSFILLIFCVCVCFASEFSFVFERVVVVVFLLINSFLISSYFLFNYSFFFSWKLVYAMNFPIYGLKYFPHTFYLLLGIHKLCINNLRNFINKSVCCYLCFIFISFLSPLNICLRLVVVIV